MTVDCMYHIDLGLHGNRCRVGKVGKPVKLGEKKLSLGEISIVTSKDCEACIKYPITYNSKHNDRDEEEPKSKHKLDRKL